jgi:hypothetical protein
MNYESCPQKSAVANLAGGRIGALIVCVIRD